MKTERKGICVELVHVKFSKSYRKYFTAFKKAICTRKHPALKQGGMTILFTYNARGNIIYSQSQSAAFWSASAHLISSALSSIYADLRFIVSIEQMLLTNC